MPDPLARRRHQFRRAGPRWLVYPPTGIAENRAQWVRAWRADLQVRAAELALFARSGAPARRLRSKERALKAQTRAAEVLGRWVWVRTKMLGRAGRGRKFRGPWDRAYTAFWLTVMGDRSWRRLEPGLWDYELAYGPVIDQLAPDLIHANDFRMLGVGARAAIRALDWCVSTAALFTMLDPGTTRIIVRLHSLRGVHYLAPPSGIQPCGRPRPRLQAHARPSRGGAASAKP